MGKTSYFHKLECLQIENGGFRLNDSQWFIHNRTHNSLKVELTQMSTINRMDKQILIHIFGEHKSNLCWVYVLEWNYWIILYVYIHLGRYCENFFESAWLNQYFIRVSVIHLLFSIFFILAIQVAYGGISLWCWNHKWILLCSKITRESWSECNNGGQES